MKYDTISVINKIRESIPQRFKARYIKEDINVYINDEGEDTSVDPRQRTFINFFLLYYWKPG